MDREYITKGESIMSKQIYILFIASVLIAFLTIGCCPQNPELNTAISAHGNTDWHIDTAEEFLLGTDMGGTPTAANHCPDTWTRRHIHVGVSNTNHFYYDDDLTTPGDDSDNTSGIDQAMLFFYAGHGNPTLWNTLGNNATQSNMSLGDCPGDGLLRYYWQCSCEVFAHGARTCPGATFHYSCPGSFDGSADSFNMRNVYERWGPVLDPDLRMACGASTSAYCHETQMNRIWDNYNNNSFDVADSFIDGLNMWGVVPLCITMGGSDVTATPLYDSMFTNQPNTSGTSHYHIQFLSNFASTPRTSALSSSSIPEMLPIIKVKPMPLPRALSNVRFKTRGNLLLSPDEVDKRGPRVRVNRLSGAVYVVGKRQLTVKRPVLKEEEYINYALDIIRKQAWSEKTLSKPEGAQIMIQAVPVDSKRKAQPLYQKNVIVTFKRQIDVNGVSINFLGSGGVIRVQMNNDGSILNASKVWRPIVDMNKRVRVKKYKEAYQEALEQMKNPQAYKLDDWTWGYKEAAGNVKQTDLQIVFRFGFVPVDPETQTKYPPRMIEIPGQII